MSTYVAPYIDATGCHIPAYADIVGDLIAQAQSIYGPDVYLGPDSQDYQFISIFAAKINDSNQLLQAVYNARSPATAVGAALDSVVKINGMARIAATYSTCAVTLTGTGGTPITNGLAQDTSGYQWSIPSTVIGSGGTVTVAATCTTAGAIAANPGDISIIVTPTYGWSSVTNSAAATVGVSLEADSALRSRQSVSTAQPSQSLLEGLEGAIAAVPGVTRFVVDENDTGSADANGNPAHSVSCVVEGGDQTAVATAIWQHRGIGVLMNGAVSVPITDQNGTVTNVGFSRPTYLQIDVTVNLKMLAGYTSATGAAVQVAIVALLNSWQIAGDSTVLPLSALWGAALSVMTTPTSPTFSITSLTAAIHGQTQGTADIPLTFGQTPQGVASFVTVTPS